MRNERGEFSGIRGVLAELSSTAKDTMLEPIRVCQAMKEKLTDTSSLTTYPNWNPIYKALFQFRGYLLAYLPINIPTIMALSVIAEGKVVNGLILGGASWVIGGAFMLATEPQKKSQIK